MHWTFSVDCAASASCLPTLRRKCNLVWRRLISADRSTSEARRHLIAVLRYAPGNPQYHYLMATALAEDETCDPERAAAYYRRSLALDPQQPKCLCEYGLLLLDLGLAQKQYNAQPRAVAIAADDAHAVDCLVRVLLATDQKEEAQAALRAALFRNPANSQFRKLWNDFQFHELRLTQAAARELSAADGERRNPCCCHSFASSRKATWQSPAARSYAAMFRRPHRRGKCSSRLGARNTGMLNDLVAEWVRWLAGGPCFRIYGKIRREGAFALIDVFATHRRDRTSRWPLWKASCTTWSDKVIVVGWDFAFDLLREQAAAPASREHPVEVAGGCLRDMLRRADAGVPNSPTASEVLAHECGHTWQALRLGWFYLPVVGSVTLFREGPHVWNHFENEASAQGQFGGVVNRSVSEELMKQLRTLARARRGQSFHGRTQWRSV